MSTRNTISDVAARTGFSASALRFYESAGLITPERSESGYRLYDERAIERLRFISRAKQLGLSLDEITELVVLWDGDQCAPVAQRLHDLVAAKVTETQARINELVAFAGDLQRFGAALATNPEPGPCSDGCGCNGDAKRVAVALGRRDVIADEPPPIACTLDPSQVGERVTQWQALLVQADPTPRRVDGGVAVHFPVGTELGAQVGALVAAEQSCCNFFTFNLRIDRNGTELTVTAPSDAAPLVDALFGVRA